MRCCHNFSASASLRSHWVGYNSGIRELVVVRQHSEGYEETQYIFISIKELK